MSRYEKGTNVPPRYEFGRIDENGKFQLIDRNDPKQFMLGSYIKVAKGLPAKLKTNSARGIKQAKKKALKKAKLARL